MPIDRKHVGRTLPRAVLEVEAGRLRFFAKAIGESDPIYFEEPAALAAGYPSLPAPPTFIFAAMLDGGTMARALFEMGVDVRRVLHGEQGFTYHAPICAGDTITVETRISDIYEKSGGALEFIALNSAASRQDGSLAAEMRALLVVRH